MFNLQPGQGLGSTGNKLVALGLGTVAKAKVLIREILYFFGKGKLELNFTGDTITALSFTGSGVAGLLFSGDTTSELNFTGDSTTELDFIGNMD